MYEKKDGDVTESRCILCTRCIEVCPYDDALELTFLGKPFMKSKLARNKEKCKVHY